MDSIPSLSGQTKPGATVGVELALEVLVAVACLLRKRVVFVGEPYHPLSWPRYPVTNVLGLPKSDGLAMEELRCVTEDVATLSPARAVTRRDQCMAASPTMIAVSVADEKG